MFFEKDTRSKTKSSKRNSISQTMTKWPLTLFLPIGSFRFRKLILPFKVRVVKLSWPNYTWALRSSFVSLGRFPMRLRSELSERVTSSATLTKLLERTQSGNLPSFFNPLSTVIVLNAVSNWSYGADDKKRERKSLRSYNLSAFEQWRLIKRNIFTACNGGE